MANTSKNIVEINNLTFYRGKRLIFDGVNIDIQRGKVTAIMGPSGSGKTTLLRLIGAQLAPSQGNIVVDGEDVGKLSHKNLFRLRRKMGMLFQSGALFSDLNVFDNVAFPIREHTSLPPDMVRSVVLMKLQAVGLRGALDLMPSELSGGMARRVALARAIALDPDLVMYDEPFAGQDPISMGVLMQLIRLLNDALNITSVIVSHDVHETLSIADYIYVIGDGKIIGQGTPAEITSAKTGWVRQFIGGMPDGPVPFHYPAGDYYRDLTEANSDR